MHNNYFFLKKLTAQLGDVLAGARLMQCFKQNKDELVLEFKLKADELFYIQASLGDHFSCLYFPQIFHRARHNTVDLFTQLQEVHVASVEQVKNERAFIIHFVNHYTLLFKLFGNRSNVILFNQKTLVSLFKSRLRQDLTIQLEALPRELDLSYERLDLEGWNIKRSIFTLGEIGQNYLRSLDFDELPPGQKYEMLCQVLLKLDSCKYYLIQWDGKVHLSLLPLGQILEEHNNALTAINRFFHAHYKFNHGAELKKILIGQVTKQINDTTSFINKVKARQHQLSSEIAPGQLADIIMANLHAIPANTERILLSNFYNNNAPVEVKLKRSLTPQKIAEQLYRKHKNRHLEISQIQDTLEHTNARLTVLTNGMKSLKKIEDYHELQQWEKQWKLKPAAQSDTSAVKFKSCEYLGYKIFIGRNAGNNDELTQQFAHKDDLWLHAKDVTGSHVIVKHQAGKPFPRPVIERAASIAAYNSKRKNESLTPVMYTLKKFVRKVKGAPKGAVKVEKETVIMVAPAE